MSRHYGYALHSKIVAYRRPNRSVVLCVRIDVQCYKQVTRTLGPSAK